MAHHHAGVSRTGRHGIYAIPVREVAEVYFAIRLCCTGMCLIGIPICTGNFQLVSSVKWRTGIDLNKVIPVRSSGDAKAQAR